MIWSWSNSAEHGNKQSLMKNFKEFSNKQYYITKKIWPAPDVNSHSDLCLYNQLFALFHYVFKFLTP